MSRMDKIRAGMNKKVAHPAGDVDAPELRKGAVLREMAAYMKEAAPKNDSKFHFLQYGEAREHGWGRPVEEGCSTCPLVARIEVLARLYAGIDTTSCQAERIFSASSGSSVVCAPVLWLTRQRRCCCSGPTATLLSDFRG